MNRGNPERMREVVFEVIENRIRNNDPPETGQTLERLLREGYVRDEAMKLIGCALTNEIFGIMKNSEPFDNIRYIANLNRLPELPWEDHTQGRH